MKYTVVKIEANKTTSTGKNFHKVSLQSVDGPETYDDVAIWEGFPSFGTITFDSLVEGDVVTKNNGQYVNRTLYAPRAERPATGRTTRSGGIAEAMDRKEKSISAFQEEKENGIKISSTLRDAVTLAKTEVDAEVYPVSELKERIMYWREWLWKNWNTPLDYPPF